MILKVPYGVSPTFDLAIGGASVDYQAVNSLELELEENKHDMLLIGMAGIPTRAVTEYRNLPVRLTFNTGPGYADEFTGYVSEVRPFNKTAAGLVNGSPFQDVTIVCLGVSYDMRGAKSRQWDNSKIEDVAEFLARTYNMSLDAPSTNLLFPNIVQDNESDWQFLCRYAQLMGLSVSAHNTHLHLYDPHLAAARLTSYHKLITSSAAKGDVNVVPGKIGTFHGTFADRHPNGSYKNTIVTVQQDDGTTFDVSSAEVFGVTGTPRFSDRLNEIAHNYAEAQHLITQRSKELYDYEAEVECVGVAGVQPGGVVLVDQYKAEYDGLWYVKNVKHRITSGAFVSNLCIVRNQDSELDKRVVTARFTAPPRPTFDRVWRTSKRIYNVY